MDFALSPEQEVTYKNLALEILNYRSTINKNRSLELLSNFFIKNGFSKDVLKHQYNEIDIKYALSIYKLINLYKDILKEKSLQYTGDKNTFLSPDYCNLDSLNNINNIVYTLDNNNYINLSSQFSDITRFAKRINLESNNIPIIKKVNNSEEIEQSNPNNQKVLLQYETQRSKINNEDNSNNTNSQDDSRKEVIKQSFWDSEYGKKLDIYIQNLKGFDPKTITYTALGTFLAGLGIYSAVKLWKKYKSKSKVKK